MRKISSKPITKLLNTSLYGQGITIFNGCNGFIATFNFSITSTFNFIIDISISFIKISTNFLANYTMFNNNSLRIKSIALPNIRLSITITSIKSTFIINIIFFHFFLSKLNVINFIGTTCSLLGLVFFFLALSSLSKSGLLLSTSSPVLLLV